MTHDTTICLSCQRALELGALSCAHCDGTAAAGAPPFGEEETRPPPEWPSPVATPAAGVERGPQPPGQPAAASAATTTPHSSVYFAPQSRVGPNGRYRTVGLLGSGGFAATYLAEDSELFDALCVIKCLVLPAGVSAKEQGLRLASLDREARLLVQLKTPGHPNIPDVYEYLAGDRCLVMKYVEGQRLGDWLAQRPPTLREAEVVRCIRDACSALAYIHARGILHLDLKPDNLLCDNPSAPHAGPQGRCPRFG